GLPRAMLRSRVRSCTLASLLAGCVQGSRQYRATTANRLPEDRRRAACSRDVREHMRRQARWLSWLAEPPTALEPTVPTHTIGLRLCRTPLCWQCQDLGQCSSQPVVCVSVDVVVAMRHVGRLLGGAAGQEGLAFEHVSEF